MVNNEEELNLSAREVAQREEARLAAEAARSIADEIVDVDRRGKSNKDPNNHLMDFDEIMNTFRYNGASHEAIYLRAFPFSLKDDVKKWLRSLPTGSIRTWEEMTTKFLEKYFSAAKTGRMRKEIYNFSQGEGETVFEAWEIFSELLRRCPHNGLEQWMQLQYFWDGLNPLSRRLMNSAVVGPLLKKTPKEIVTLLNELSEYAEQWSTDQGDRRRSAGVHEVESSVAMQAQIAAMAKDIKQPMIVQVQNQPHVGCAICELGHPTRGCQATTEEVNVVENFNKRNYQGGNNYNAMGQRHLGFLWSSANGSLNTWQQNNLRPQGQGPPGFQSQ
ncbi:uncharacterized protein [Nicotiana tomentosiformis]|uniref:uncharacterized protein n=1 Tax=Nicotiana tomentosiformis TaxID=4098 RepID=UPI00388CAA94